MKHSTGCSLEFFSTAMFKSVPAFYRNLPSGFSKVNVLIICIGHHLPNMPYSGHLSTPSDLWDNCKLNVFRISLKRLPRLLKVFFFLKKKNSLRLN